VTLDPDGSAEGRPESEPAPAQDTGETRGSEGETSPVPHAETGSGPPETGADEAPQPHTAAPLPDERKKATAGTKPRRFRGAAAGLVGAGAGVSFMLLQALPLPARVWAAVLLVPLPALLSGQHRLIGDPTRLPRIPVYSSSIISLWLMAFITALATRASGFAASSVAVGGIEIGPGILWAAGATAIGMGLVFAANALDIGATDLVEALIPRSREEKSVFAGLSVTAGVCEEFVFRGFLISVITLASGSLLLGVLASTLVFGWMHTYQGAKGAAGAGLLGAMLAVPVIATGSLLPSMVAHAAIDILTGIVFAPKLYDQVA